MLTREPPSWTPVTLTSKLVFSFCVLDQAMEALRLLLHKTSILKLTRRLGLLVLHGLAKRNSHRRQMDLPLPTLLKDQERTGPGTCQMSTHLHSLPTHTRIVVNHSEVKRHLLRASLHLNRIRTCGRHTPSPVAGLLRLVEDHLHHQLVTSILSLRPHLKLPRLIEYSIQTMLGQRRLQLHHLLPAMGMERIPPTG